jgi:solute:Na+ symporter, SSS family
MSSYLILGVFLAYTILIFGITYFTSRKADNQTFFVGNKVSPWYVVAYGMIGASLSGVTFMSIPGKVRVDHFSYMILVFGYLAGYFVIAKVLLPLYYRLNLTSIYSYLEKRFGFWTYKTGAGFFFLSRTMGASLRMLVVINVFHEFVLKAWGVPFWVSVLIFILLIITYTLKGGIKTIVWTDTLQTTFMLLAVGMSIFFISREMHFGFGQLVSTIFHSDYSNLMVYDWHRWNFWLKHFLGGAFIAIAMTGLDQEMMQKNLSCRNLKEAQTNMYTFSGILIIVNFVFLFLGASLWMFAASKNISPGFTDDLFPTIALKFLGPVGGIIFLVGLISAAYPSADGALTSLTTSFYIDFIGVHKLENFSDKQKRWMRYAIHFGISLIFLVVIVIFKSINDRAIIDKLFTIAGYTYGPLLGFFSFGLFTKWDVKDGWMPMVAIISPIICYILSVYSKILFSGYVFGFELLIINGLLTFLGMYLLKKKSRD